MTVYKIARFEVDPGAVESVEEAMREFARFVGTELDDSTWTTYREKGGPNSYLSIITADDAAAERRHRDASGTKDFANRLYPNVIGDVVFTDYELVASSE